MVLALDVSDPSRLKVLGTYREPGFGKEAHYSWQGSGRRAALGRDDLYVILGSEAIDDPRIAVLDVRNPARMKKVFVTPRSTPAFQDDWFDSRLGRAGDMFNDCFLRGSYLFVSDYWGGVRIYDLQTADRPKLIEWEFQPYLSLVPDNWSRELYNQAVASGDLQKFLKLTAQRWGQRHEIGRKLWNQDLMYHPGYELFGWNIGEMVRGYLVQPKLCGLAVYRVPLSSEKPTGPVRIEAVAQ